MAQPVKHLTLDFCSGRDLTIREFEPRIRLCGDSAGPAWDSLSLSLSAPPAQFHKINKLKKKKTSLE